MAGVRQIHGGWGSFTFSVTGDHIVRFARTPSVAAAHRREAALLPLLAPAVSFAVPEPDLFVDLGDRTCIGYPVIPGRPMTAADDWRALAGVLRELHGFSVDAARGVLGWRGGGAGGRVGRVDADVAGWRDYYVRFWADVSDRVLPVLDDGLRVALVGGYRAFLGGDWDFAPVLVHRDLAPEHVLVDERGGVVGLIDFEDAAVGDPAIDFAGLLGFLGRDRVEVLLADYGRPVSWERLLCYWWLVPVHDLLHGLDTRDDAIVADAVAELRVRLSGGGLGFRDAAATDVAPSTADTPRPSRPV